MVGLLELLRLTGSSSSPREKNWPLLALLPPAGAAPVTAAAGEPKLTRSEDELPPAPETVPLSCWVRSSAAGAVPRLSCEAREFSESREPEPSLLNAE